MKIFNRTSLPESIKYNNKVYTLNTSISNLLNQNIKIDDYVQIFKSLNKNMIQVNVLSRRLKGKRDLHNNLYKPTEWLYLEK